VSGTGKPKYPELIVNQLLPVMVFSLFKATQGVLQPRNSIPTPNSSGVTMTISGASKTRK
jgi:hypothetical protein